MNKEEKFKVAKDKIILALDVPTLKEAERLVKILAPFVGYFKVGLELITAEGARNVVSKIKSLGGKIFYDGKLSDIPNTVAKTSGEISKMNVDIFSIHASSTMTSMQAAVNNKGRSKVYAVTVLTSIDECETLLTFGSSPKAKVLQMARDAVLAGCDGIICSPQELEMLKGHPELSELRIITPGIRPAFASNNDQKRIMTPGEAIRAGATHIVIGRPITNPPKGMTSEVAARKVLMEVYGALEMQLENEAQKIHDIFDKTGAIIANTHVVYTSGRHGDIYVNKDAIYVHTKEIGELCRYIAENFQDEDIDAVIGPVVGGVVLGQWTAHYLSRLLGKEVVALFADKEGSGTETKFVIKRGQDQFIKGKKILVVEDIITTGGSVKKVIAAVGEMGGSVVGVGALCNRGGVTAKDIGNVPKFKSLVDLKLTTYDAGRCPLCKSKISINTKIGKGKDFLKNKKSTPFKSAKR